MNQNFNQNQNQDSPNKQKDKDTPNKNSNSDIKLLNQQQIKILQTSIYPYKITKDIKALIEKISKKESTCLKIVPNAYPLRGNKDTFKHSIALNILLMMLCKVNGIKLELYHNKLSKKSSSQDNVYSAPMQTSNLQFQSNWKFITYLNENYNNQNKKKTKQKSSSQQQQKQQCQDIQEDLTDQNLKIFQNFIIQFKDQPQKQNQVSSVNFAISLLQNLIKVQPFNKIIDLKLINHYPLASDFQCNQQRFQLMKKLCKNVSAFLSHFYIEKLTIRLQYQQIIFQDICQKGKPLKHLFTLVIEQQNKLDEKVLFDLLKLTPNLCILKIDAHQFGQISDLSVKILLEQILQQNCPMIQKVIIAKQKLPKLNPQLFSKILFKCPFLGEIVTFNQFTEYQEYIIIEKIIQTLRMRQISIGNQINLIKIVDYAQGFSFDTCLSILNCCEQFKF